MQQPQLTAYPDIGEVRMETRAAVRNDLLDMPVHRPTPTWYLRESSGILLITSSDEVTCCRVKGDSPQRPRRGI
jgi:hypothetical protein